MKTNLQLFGNLQGRATLRRELAVEDEDRPRRVGVAVLGAGFQRGRVQHAGLLAASSGLGG